MLPLGPGNSLDSDQYGLTSRTGSQSSQNSEAESSRGNQTRRRTQVAVSSELCRPQHALTAEQ